MPEDEEIQFSLFFFSADGSSMVEDKYRLLEESVTFADAHGFSAVWVPERHFHAFGGLYPNPSVVGAALAMITKHIQIRAGSVVLPLQNPIRVVEEWSVIDNLSKGRVGLSFASGWHADDFVLAPANYDDRKEIMFQGIKLVQRLWRGGTIRLPNSAGKEVEIRTFPRPLQPDVTIWVTCQSDQTFIRAGEIGANVLTNLNYKSIKDLARKINLYRESLHKHDFPPSRGHITLMMHTFLGTDIDQVKAKVKSAYSEYLLVNLGLQERFAQGVDLGIEVTEEDRQFLMANAIERLFQTHGLIGTPETCYQVVRDLKAIGVNEIACLIDFGLDTESVIDGLYQLDRLRLLCR